MRKKMVRSVISSGEHEYAKKSKQNCENFMSNLKYISNNAGMAYEREKNQQTEKDINGVVRIF